MAIRDYTVKRKSIVLLHYAYGIRALVIGYIIGMVVFGLQKLNK